MNHWNPPSPDVRYICQEHGTTLGGCCDLGTPLDSPVTPVDEGKRMGISGEAREKIRDLRMAAYDDGLMSEEAPSSRTDAAEAALESYIASLEKTLEDALVDLMESEVARPTLESRLREATLDSARLDELERLLRRFRFVPVCDLDGHPAGWQNRYTGLSWPTLREAADASLKTSAVSPVSSGEAE